MRIVKELYVKIRFALSHILILRPYNIIIFTEDGENAIETSPDYSKQPSMRTVSDRMTSRLTGNLALRFDN